MDVAAEHGTFQEVGVVYSPLDRTIRDDPNTPGIKLITFAPQLKQAEFPLLEALSFLLSVGRTAFSFPVEIEFAATYRKDGDPPLELAFLQIRPMGFSPTGENVDFGDVEHGDTICVSSHALGHGMIEDVRDLVYVSPTRFSRVDTDDIAQEIGVVNAQLKEKERPYLLIGPGRWGSADPRLGIPVSWSQISQASCIVETDMKEIRVNPSQGSHFFQNIISFGIAYLNVNIGESGGFLNVEWLDGQQSEAGLHHVVHLSFDKPLEITVDGRSGKAVVMKPGEKTPRHL
jgi:hypothetical protein